MSDLEELNAMLAQEARDKLQCDYDSSRGRGAQGVSCYKGKPTRRVTIIYNPGVYGRDEVITCEPCYKALKRQVRRHGYKLESKRI